MSSTAGRAARSAITNSSVNDVVMSQELGTHVWKMKTSGPLSWNFPRQLATQTQGRQLAVRGLPPLRSDDTAAAGPPLLIRQTTSVRLVHS